MRRLFVSFVLLLALFLVAGCGEAVKTTLPPIANATATKQSAVQPRFGGHLADFEARFGQPNDHSTASNGDYHFARWPNSNIDEIIAETDVVDGAAYNTLVFNLSVQSPDAGWSLSTAESMCAAYLPTDAVKNGSPVNVVPSGQSNVIGMDVIYRSASLANVFPASEFVDYNQKPVSPGLFDVMYIYNAPNDSSRVAGCQMLPGTQQTSA